MKRLLVLSLILISSVFQTTYVFANKQKTHQSILLAQESLVTVNIPINIVKRELKSILTHEDSPITYVERLDFDPLNRLLVLEAKAELPGDVLQSLEDAAGGFSLYREFDLKIVLRLPSARLLSVSSFVQFEFISFKLDGQEYVNSFGILGRLFATLMSHSSFVDFILDINPEVPLDSSDPTMLAKQFIERKNIRFRENTVSFRLNLSEFADLSRFAEIDDLRLWQFSPVLLTGTDQVVFRIEAGVNRPGELWLNNAIARGERESRSLSELRGELYSNHSYQAQKHGEKFEQMIAEIKHQLELEIEGPFLNNEVDRLQSTLNQRARSALSMGNLEFLSHPEETYYHFFEESREFALSTLADLQRRQRLAQQNIIRSRKEDQQWPFLQKRLSQKSVDQAVRFFRDFDFEGEDLFSQLNIVLAPQLPGVVARGIVNLDFNYLISMGFEDSDVNLGELPIRLAEDQYGSGVPFELTVRAYMLPNSTLAMDIRSLSLFTGSQRIFFEKSGRNGQFILNFAKMAIAHSLAATWIDLPGDSDDVRDPYKVLRQHIQQQEEIYRALDSRLRDFSLAEALKNLTLVDIQNNPFITVGRDFVAGKTELILKELIKYDEESEMLLIHLNPRVISESILASDNQVQVWNVMPIYDHEANQTYLELALGDNERTLNYVKHLETRDEYYDSAGFTGLSIDQTESTDLSVTLDLESFKDLVNSILAEAYDKQNTEVRAKLRTESEVEAYILQDFSLDVSEEGQLQVDVLLTHIEKKRRSPLNPARWFGDKYPITERSIGVKADLEMDLVPLSNYERELSLVENEVFFHDQVLRLDLQRVQVRIGGDVSILDRMINTLAGDLNFSSGLSQRVKRLVMGAIGRYLNPRDKDSNENVQLRGVRLNQYAKILAHRDEFLLQLNPHILGKSFEVRMRKPMHSSQLRPLVDLDQDVLRFDFSTVGNMANADKNELYRIMLDAEELFRPILAAQSPEELDVLLRDHQFANQLFRNSDYTKMSLYHRFIHVLTQYRGMIAATHPDLRIMQGIHQQVSSHLDLTIPELESRQITTTGVELMYFLSTAFVLYDQIEQYLLTVEQFEAYDSPYFDAIVEMQEDFLSRFILPLMDHYAGEFKSRNQAIVNRGVTDWNHSFYPDARYSQSIYQILTELLDLKMLNRLDH